MPQFASPITALDWYLAAGVDEVIDEAPIDHFAAARQKAATSAHALPADRRGRPPDSRVTNSRATAALPTTAQRTPADEAAVADADARAVALTTQDIPALERAIRAYDGCPLKRAARNTVIADGVPEAPLMLIGEAPGAEEDAAGRPFVGRAGQLLDRMLKAIGHDRKRDAYITNVIFWRPPGNRKPDPVETATCRPFVERLITLVAPKVIVLLGGTPTTALLETTEGITRQRGRWREIQGIPTLPTYHPAYLLRQPAAKRDAWRDLLAAKLKLDESLSR